MRTAPSSAAFGVVVGVWLKQTGLRYKMPVPQSVGCGVILTALEFLSLPLPLSPSTACGVGLGAFMVLSVAI